MLRPADVHRGRALRVGLGAVHVRPRGGVQHELRRRLDRRRRQGHVPVVPRERRQLVARERLPERAAELAAGPGQEDASRSRSERIGDAVLQRWRTRSSSHGIPCSSGSAGSYSRVT